MTLYAYQRRWPHGSLLAVTLLSLPGPCYAQLCSLSNENGTHCSLTLSEPQTFLVKADAVPPPRTADADRVIVKVNGRPCRTVQYRLFSKVHASCRVALPPGVSVIDAVAGGFGNYSTPVKITLVANGRLAEIPREAADLYPAHHRTGLWRLLHLFNH